MDKIVVDRCSPMHEAELKKRTLTNLYNQRPTWLALAHEKLDHAVLDAYGWPHDLGDDELGTTLGVIPAIPCYPSRLF